MTDSGEVGPNNFMFPKCKTCGELMGFFERVVRLNEGTPQYRAYRQFYANCSKDCRGIDKAKPGGKRE